MIRMSVFILVVFFALSCDSETGLFDSPPAGMAEKFAPERVSSADKEHGKLTVSPDGRQLLWDYLKLPHEQEAGLVIGVTTQANGKWSARQRPAFARDISAWSPCYWGRDRILFITKKDVGEDPVRHVDEIWRTDLQNGTWSEPAPLGFHRFTEAIKWTLSVTTGGDLYFDARNYEKGQYGWGIYVSRYANGEYAEPVLLPEHINSTDFDWTPFIAPDESYLLFASNRSGGLGSTDIFVSFRADDGSWSQPVPLDERVNSVHLERWPSLTSDGKILFFQRDYIVNDKMQEQDYYWIDAGIIDEFKPDYLK